MQAANPALYLAVLGEAQRDARRARSAAAHGAVRRAAPRLRAHDAPRLRAHVAARSAAAHGAARCGALRLTARGAQLAVRITARRADRTALAAARARAGRRGWRPLGGGRQPRAPGGRTWAPLRLRPLHLWRLQGVLHRPRQGRLVAEVVRPGRPAAGRPVRGARRRLGAAPR